MRVEPKATEVATVARPFVDTLLLATVLADAERERVDAIQRRVLAEDCYYGRGERITDPKRDWHMDDVSAKNYYARLNGIHLREGFEDAAKGNCPALTAEHLKIQAEWALIEAVKPFFGITNDRLLCGTKTEGGLETRKKFIDLLIGLVVKSPGYSLSLGRAVRS